MSSELEIYKQNKINEITNIFSSNVVRLTSDLAANIINIQLSLFTNKQDLINALISKYNTDISILRNNFNENIQIINALKPKVEEPKIEEPKIEEPKVEEPKVNSINKKALLIGIDYINTPYRLNACINDANRMKDLLSSKGFNDIKMLTDLTDIKPTRSNILNEFKNLIVNSKAGDILFFYYAGHGTYIRDINRDETDLRDEVLFSSDLQNVVDDELKSIIEQNLPREVTIIGMFDACYSGTMFDLRYNYLDSNNYTNSSNDTRVSQWEGNAITISACMDRQTSTEQYIKNDLQGVFTWSFIETINKTPNCSWRELMRSMRDLLISRNVAQRPQLSTGSNYNIDTKIII